MLAPLGLRLSPAKTRIVHLSGGFDFLGFRIQRKRERGTAGTELFHLGKVPVTRYRYRGSKIPSPWVLNPA